jgi:hypothetical protein
VKYLTRRNVIGVGIGLAIGGVVWLIAVYAGQVLALVAAGAMGLLIGAAIGMEIIDEQVKRELSGVHRDLNLERERVTALETTNAKLRGLVADHKGKANAATEMAANHLDRARAAEARLAEVAQ